MDRHVFEIEIRAPAERIWDAIVRGERTRRYFFGTRVESSFEPGAPIRWVEDDGSVALDGTVLVVEPPRRLVTSFVMTHHEEGRLEAPSRVTWEIEPRADRCLLRLVHDELPAGGPTSREVRWGWPTILEGLRRETEG